MDDIRAVMDAAGSSKATVFGVSEGGTLSLLFAHRHPERAQALILYGSWARRLVGPGYPWGLQPDELEAFLDGMGRAWDTGEWWDHGHPSPNDDERHRRWWARYLRMAASPAMAQNVIRMNTQMDLRELLPDITLPTLILHRIGDRWIEVGHARYMAEHIPGATYVELPGEDHRPWLGDVDAIGQELDEVEAAERGGILILPSAGEAEVGVETPPGGVPARVNAAVADNTHVRRGLSGRFPGRLARQVPATGPPKLSTAGIIAWCPYHRMLPLPRISRSA
jgi:hypothetical protein